MEMNHYDLATLAAIPLFQMNGAQLISIIKLAFGHEAAPPRERSSVPEVQEANKYAYGIAGICEIFGCSKPTAQRIKKSGVIDGAITQTGRTIVVDRQKALALVAEDAAKKKGGEV